MQALENKPAYVSFEIRAEENRQASIEQGHFVAVDVEYAVITPPGSKDRIDRKVSEWFPQLDQQVREERLPAAWAESYKAAYRAWKEGQELPVEGTALRVWPVISPAQLKMLLDLHVRSVEELALANEELIGRLGMGGRALKQKAVEWLASSKDSGKQVEEISALKVENETLKEQNLALEANMKELAKRLELLEKASGPKKL